MAIVCLTEALLFLSGRYLRAPIVTASRANMMEQLLLATMQTVHQRGRSGYIMCAALATALLRMSSFWKWHKAPSKIRCSISIVRKLS